MSFTIRWWALCCYLFASVAVHTRGNLGGVSAMPLDNPKELRDILPHLLNLRVPDFAEKQLQPDLKQRHVQIPDFMLQNYKDMNQHYCDRRVIRSVPGKATEENSNLPLVLSFVVTPFQKDDEIPYNAEIRLSFRSQRTRPRESNVDSRNATELFQIAVWTVNNLSQSYQQEQEVLSQSGSTRRTRSYNIPEDSYPVFDDILRVPITQNEGLKDGGKAEAIIDLHSTEVIGKLSRMQEACQIILEIRPLSTHASHSERIRSVSHQEPEIRPNGYFVVHSLRRSTKCFQTMMASPPPFEVPVRTKRAAGFLRTRDGESELRPRQKRLCHKRSLYVDFQAIGWDQWIVAPSGYWAHYCDGSCPFPMSERVNSTNHAILQSLLHTMLPRIPSSCCTPSKLKAISILYVDQNEHFVLKQYEDMVVEACSCQ